ncbi:MAG: phosphoribosylformylglycinamidine synthase subunit PurL [Candidatus Omnitrophica bacterium]|nr:phosphoribosylformylglycinamidine synthase subunit PurL [Candidatus Omnitrophota bacterium]
MKTAEEIKLTPEIIQKHGITPAEYGSIKKILGREPNLTELGIFSVMWSEHCSYKNSKNVLKLLPKDGPRMLVKAGEENAGVVDIGDGLVVVFKMESHNHPSAIEPFQGAATGVGGILRDIFTMGARPIASMNSLRFGKLDDNGNTKRLLSGVVAGISHYGNCIGVPTIGGEIYFDESYEGNPLVNAFALGLARREEIVKAKAEGTGNPVFYLGAATGRDGMGGAAFASKDLSEASEKDRPAVQVGDPFLEKLLLEAVLELLKSGCVVGIQDMGAAGLTCSTCETASRGNTGVEIDVAKVPQRETGMVPYEIMLSESQERMLVILKKGREAEAKRIFEKWDLHAEAIGLVTDDGLMRVKENGVTVSEIPAKKLADDAPVYIREEKEPAYLKSAGNFDPKSLGSAGDLNAVLLKLLDAPSIASKEWVYGQYDHMVRTNTVVLPGSDASVIRIKGTNKSIAISTDGNSTYCYLDPYEGAKIAVAEAARNVACAGAVPLSITNCLNFGNPMNPEIFWTLKKCIEGIRDACLAFETPVSGGNVSLYNQNPKGAIDPTPTIGMVGLIEGREPVTSHFKNEGDVVILLGQTREELGGSEFLKTIFGVKAGVCPRLDLKEAKALNDLMIRLAKENLLASAHDCAEGGLAVALAESCISNKGYEMGAAINVGATPARPAGGRRVAPTDVSTEALLFGESQSRVVISVSPKNLKKAEEVIQSSATPYEVIGKTGGEDLAIQVIHRGLTPIPVRVLSHTWRNAIGRRMRG